MTFDMSCGQPHITAEGEAQQSPPAVRIRPLTQAKFTVTARPAGLDLASGHAS